MSNENYIIDALKKVYPVIEGNKLRVSCSEMDATATLDKDSFIHTLLKEYGKLIEAEIKEKYDFVFDADFFGCLVEGASFKIEENSKRRENGKITFKFLFLYPQSDKEIKNDEIPKRIDVSMNWEETKSWCEHIIKLNGKKQELFTLVENLKKELLVTN